jgi:hypothetical protein
MGPYVYFMRPKGMAGPVKIGHSFMPTERLLTYNAISPFPLEIVALYEGQRWVENQFHLLFEDLHSHHEWFRASPEIDAVIAQINAGTFDHAVLPMGRRPKWWGKNRHGLKAA